MDNPNIDNTETVKNPSPFITFTARTIPATFDTSMSYQEALFTLVNYLQTQVTPAINENAEITNEQTKAINELYDFVNHYFDNLDVQEEINNKLDDMAESGELAEIIAQFLGLGSVYGFDTISDMASSTYLIDGSICKTLGKTNALTGDGSYYRVRQRTNADNPDGVNLVVLTNTTNLVAEIIPDYSVNFIQKLIADTRNPIFYGADPTGVNDSTSAINSCIQANKGGSIIFPGGTYLISSPILLPFEDSEKVDIIGNGAKIITTSTINSFIDVGYDREDDNNQNEAGFRTCLIENLNLDGSNGNVDCGIINRCGFKDLKINKCSIFRVSKGIQIGELSLPAKPSDVIIDNCMIFGKGSEYDSTGIYSKCSDNRVINTRLYGFRTSIHAIGLIHINNVHGLLRWAEQTASNFDPYPINSSTFDEYYTQTTFIKCEGEIIAVECYCDSLYNMLSWITGRAIITNSFYFNSRNVGCKIITTEHSGSTNSPWFIFKNNNIMFPNGANNISNQIIGFYTNNVLMDAGSQITIKNNLLTRVQNLSNNFDYITNEYIDDLYNRRRKRTWSANTWYVIGSIANYTPANSNWITGRFQLNGWEYPVKLSPGGINRMYKAGSSTSGNTIGVIFDETKHLAIICGKKSVEWGNINPTFEINEVINNGDPIFKINPTVNNNPIYSDTALSALNYSDPSITLELPNLDL